MNTVASQVTLFTDDSVDCAGPIRPGPSLYEWARLRRDRRDALGPGRLSDPRPLRPLPGVGVRRGGARRTAPPSRSSSAPGARDRGSTTTADGRQTLTLDDGTRLTGLAAVVLAQGHLPAVADADTAAPRRVRRPPRPAPRPARQPGRRRPSPIAPGEPVLLRGLGLNFFDHLALLTDGPRRPFRPRAPARPALPPLGPRAAAVRRFAPRHPVPGARRQREGRRTAATSRCVLTPDVIAGFRKRADSGDAAGLPHGDMAAGGEGGRDGLLRGHCSLAAGRAPTPDRRLS